ncbi:MAG TPA: hypothetical protein VN970_09975, partial [Thermoanaerobaculia bacterium]|nr:hypothetical protein [Thermoanaerobaculia bacterium]
MGIAAGERPRGKEPVPESLEQLGPPLGAALRYAEDTVAGLRVDTAFAAEVVSSSSSLSTGGQST